MLAPAADHEIDLQQPFGRRRRRVSWPRGRRFPPWPPVSTRTPHSTTSARCAARRGSPCSACPTTRPSAGRSATATQIPAERGAARWPPPRRGRRDRWPGTCPSAAAAVRARRGRAAGRARRREAARPRRARPSRRAPARSSSSRGRCGSLRRPPVRRGVVRAAPGVAGVASPCAVHSAVASSLHRLIFRSTPVMRRVPAGITSPGFDGGLDGLLRSGGRCHCGRPRPFDLDEENDDLLQRDTPVGHRPRGLAHEQPAGSASKVVAAT